MEGVGCIFLSQVHFSQPDSGDCCPFERYADDVVIHCRSYGEAVAVKASVEARLRRCRLEAHPDKTRIVYCRDDNRPHDHEHIRFDFLGYSFRPRAAKNRRTGKRFTSFLPGARKGDKYISLAAAHAS